MTVNDYLSKLDKYLKDLPSEERKDILEDYRQHFISGQAEGLSEHEIAKKLGSPLSIARQHLAEYHIEIATECQSPLNIGRAILATMALGFFNLVFILGPFLGMIGVLIGLGGGAFGVFISGLGLMRSGLLFFIPSKVISLPASLVNQPFATFILGLGSTALGILLFIALFYVSRFFIKITLKYLRWNLNIIQGK